LAALEEFVHINTGSWSGTFTVRHLLRLFCSCVFLLY
jgi:hypothetical protein